MEWNTDSEVVDSLYIAIRYGSCHYQLEVWVPKPDTSILNSEDGWSFQLPGKNVVDSTTKELVGWGYQFADLKVS